MSAKTALSCVRHTHSLYAQMSCTKIDLRVSFFMGSNGDFSDNSQKHKSPRITATQVWIIMRLPQG